MRTVSPDFPVFARSNSARCASPKGGRRACRKIFHRPVDHNPAVCNPSAVLLIEGRLLETILKAEQDAAPAGGARNPALGRPRPSRPPALTTGCLEWLHAAATKDGGSRPDQGAQEGLVHARKHGARDRKAAFGAPEGAARPPMGACTSRNGSARRRAIPSFPEGRRQGRPPRGLDKERGRRSIAFFFGN
jgi:hypothetical protein